MSELRSRTVKCKNPACPKNIEIDEGYELTPGSHGIDHFNWPPNVPKRIICTSCNEEHDYSQSDLQSYRMTD